MLGAVIVDIAAITGSIAEAYYGVPAGIREQAVHYLDKFEAKYGILEERYDIYRSDGAGDKNGG